MADTRQRGNVSERTIDSRSKEILDKIFAKQKHGNLLLDQQVISELKKSLTDSKIIDVVYDYYKKRLEQIRIKANKFKRALLEKYSMNNLSMGEIIDKAKKYTKKYDLSDGEFGMFMSLLQSDTTHPYSSSFNIPSTPMSRTLGYSADVFMGDKLSLKDGDLPILKNILDMNNETTALHRQILLQSITYTDCGPNALSGTFDKTKFDAFHHIHPIVAALFLPKIPYLDEHMLHANIGNIVKCKSDAVPIQSLPEFELYWDLISDPNQTVCVTDNTKTMEDLRNRYNLQIEIWKAVSQLRQGKYYTDKSVDLMKAIEICKSSIFDAPDLVYAHDEGTILRRILNAFSLRPTIVSISSINQEPFMMTTLNIGPTAFTQITTVPMINLRLPRPLGTVQPVFKSVSLIDAINQPQWYVHGKSLQPKTQTIIHSRDVIFFYIDRRFKAFNYAAINKPFMFTGFLPTMSGMDTMTDTTVNFTYDLHIGQDSFVLRSVVFTEVTDLGDKGGVVVTGCTAGIVAPSATYGNRYLIYDPQGATFQHQTASGSYEQYGPISDINQTSMQPNTRSFQALAEKRGTIFMYAKSQ